MATTASESEKAARNGVVDAALPLALLETVRLHDHPGEVLEDEVLTVSLPRRLGLSDVVFTQIRRYEQARESGRRISAAEIADLMRLILRRPDGGRIMEETGRRVARERYERLPGLLARTYRALPAALAFIGVRRGVRRMLRRIAGGGRVRVKGKPLVVTITGSVTGRLDDTACGLYTGALDELVELYLGKPRAVVHGRCAARGDGVCEWSLAES